MSILTRLFGFYISNNKIYNYIYFNYVKNNRAIYNIHKLLNKQWSYQKKKTYTYYIYNFIL